MARQGQFGRSTAGASNLSSAIQSLVMQQKAEEEKTFLNAFYSGTSYNGKIPTMADVIAFYNNIANLGGIDKSSVEWTAIQQKIDAANNYDVKKIYAQLNASFESSGGKNYNEFVNFLNTRAKTSNDPQDMLVYASALSDVNKAYLGYQGQALSRGEITSSQYRSLAQSLISNIPANDPNRYQTIVDTYTYEWNAEKNIYDNRLIAGKISQSQYVSWANNFTKTLSSAGINNGELFTATQAAAARAAGGSGVGPTITKTRLDNTSAELGSLFTLGSTLLGINVGNKTLTDLTTASSGGSIADITNHPEVLSSLAAYLDRHPSYTNSLLTSLGISSGDELRSFVDNSVKSGVADATVIAANGGQDNTSKWNGLASTNGANTGVDEFAAASLQWIKNKQSANGNDVLLSYYNNQWKNYLSGDPALTSIYGQRPNNFGTQAFLDLYYSEVNAINGSFTSDTATLSGTIDPNVNKDWKNIASTDANSIALQTGNGVLKWDENIGSYVYAPKQANGVANGSYQYIEYQKVDGKVISYVVSVPGQQIVIDNNGTKTAAGWVYLTPNGKTVVVNSKGEQLTGADLVQNGTSWTFGAGGTGSSSGSVPTTVNLDYIDKTNAINAASIPYNPSDPEARRAAVLGQGSSIDSQTLKDIIAATDVVSGALDSTSRMNLSTDTGNINASIKSIDLYNAQNAPDANTLAGQLRIENINSDGNVTERSKALQYVINNPNDVTQVAPGVYLKKQNQPSSSGVDLGSIGAGAAVGAGIGAALGLPFGGIGAGVTGAIGGVIGGLNTGLSELMGSAPGMAQFLDTRTAKEKSAAYAAGAATPNAQQYQATGYGEGASTFFRNMTKPVVTPSITSPSPYGGYASLQANVPNITPPIIPKVVSPAMIPFNPNDPEARRALILAQENAPVGNPAAFAGKAGGGV